MKTFKLWARELASLVLCAVLVTLVLVGMVGCAPPPPPPIREFHFQEAQSVDKYDLPNVYLMDVRLKDGTRCVYIYDTGVDCDFRGERGPE